VRPALDQPSQISRHEFRVKTFCYARVSRADQSTGLESQIRVRRQYCVGKKIGVVEFYSDEGIRGTKANRPALDRLMADVEAEEVSSVVLTEKIDTNSALGLAIFLIRGVP
jgi:DNA invertase Pin-like site-specific DNA recombinase